MLTAEQLHDLHRRADAVTLPSAGPFCARTAARLLSGTHFLTSAWGPPAMQAACARLAQGEITQTDELPISILSAAVRGLLLVFSVEHVRAALAFWASENDPAVWRAVTEDGSAWLDVTRRDGGGDAQRLARQNG